MVELHLMAKPKRPAAFHNRFMVFYWFLLALNNGLWPTTAVAAANEIGYCAPYHGKVCKSFTTSTQVWYNKVSKRSLRIAIMVTKVFFLLISLVRLLTIERCDNFYRCCLGDLFMDFNRYCVCLFLILNLRCTGGPDGRMGE